MSVALVVFLCFAELPQCETIMDRQMPAVTTCQILAMVTADQMTSPGRRHWLRVLKQGRTLTRATVECRWEETI
jgi:hypothetical protein